MEYIKSRLDILHDMEERCNKVLNSIKIDEKTELMMLRIRVKNLEKQLKELKK